MKVRGSFTFAPCAIRTRVSSPFPVTPGCASPGISQSATSSPLFPMSTPYLPSPSGSPPSTVKVLPFSPLNFHPVTGSLVRLLSGMNWAPSSWAGTAISTEMVVMNINCQFCSQGRSTHDSSRVTQIDRVSRPTPQNRP